ncbi:hypothetical protein CH281_18315 [Rhodococcus sp. 06-221-2]|uniref:biotin/lipoyl-containing protein n=1 Tax=Nocardiaceae TaxID=85025 RepID=UPI000B9C4CBC|nr:lipoyl domain-containing protein [Rhodococcus sp. 06-221-2]NIL84622.1 hypothetical protein [Rhodococcus fascians]NIL91581.1 hypothetical protein [Rhodococcus fascians]OZD00336.1 hypothetical protein CH281_18315 [Rhodococcus sp. 06-221-2]
MATEQKLQALAGGESTQAVVTTWFVEEGDQVKAGDLLVEIEAEKTASEVESEHTGVLTRIVAAVGDEIEIGDVLAEFELDS